MKNENAGGCSNDTCEIKAQSKKNTPEEKLLTDIYRNVKMGSDAVVTILSKVNDDALRRDLTVQLTGYQGFATEATKKLVDRNKAPQDLKFFEKIPAEIGLQLNTLTDQSPSKVAELMMNGSTMGIIDLQRSMNACGGACAPDVEKLGQDIVAFEEGNLEKMKAYL